VKKLLFYSVCGFLKAVSTVYCHYLSIRTGFREVRGSTRLEIPELDNGRLIHEICMYSPSKFEICTLSMEYKFSARVRAACIGETGGRFTAWLGSAHVNPSKESKNTCINGRHLCRPFKHPESFLPAGCVVSFQTYVIGDIWKSLFH